MVFEQTVQYLYDLQKFGTKLGLENTRALLELLGRPDAGRRYLHVTGTNGKGSVSAMAASALTAAGWRTGLYTSPHLVSFTERMKVDGSEISREEVVALADRLRRLIEENTPGLKPTFFEFTTAMAFEYFARENAEAVVLEVGMGGRLDSTNVVTPLCSVITNVEMEHAEYLGDTLMDIAREKAGIIKPGVPLVTSEAKPEVLEYFEGVCRELGSPMYLFGRDFGATPAGKGVDGRGFFRSFDYTGLGGGARRFTVPLAGRHQVVNAAVAACAVELASGQGLAVPGDALARGLAGVDWRGRLEVVSTRPLVVLDGAHNPASVGSLAAALSDDFAGRYNRLVLVLGVLSDKDFAAMYRQIGHLADELIFTMPAYERAVGPEKMMEAAGDAAAAVSFTDSVEEGVRRALESAGPDDMVLVSGSLYVVGEAKAYLAGKEPFLRA